MATPEQSTKRAVLGSTFLRAVSMGSKFVMVITLGLLLKPAEVGTLELMTRTLANGVMLAGMQFFLYANREFSSADPEHRADVLRNQGIFYLLNYIVVLPLLSFAFITKILDWSLAPWFYAILVSDHLSYELQRTLVSNSQAIKSNFIHTLRTGLWVYPMVGIMFLLPAVRHLQIVWMFWLGFSVLSVVLSLIWLRGLGVRDSIKKPVDWNWIKAGLKTTLGFIPVTVSLLLFTLADRYAIELLAPKGEFLNRDLVGAYGIYFMFANIVVSFPEAGIASVYQPRTIKAGSDGNWAELTKLNRELGVGLAKQIAVMATVSALVIMVSVNFVLKQPVYKVMLPAFWLILIGTCFNALTLWTTNLLYGTKQDKKIALVSVSSVIPFLILVFILVPLLGIIGASLAVAIGYGVRFGLSYYFAQRTLNDLRRVSG